MSNILPEPPKFRRGMVQKPMVNQAAAMLQTPQRPHQKASLLGQQRIGKIHNTNEITSGSPIVEAPPEAIAATQAALLYGPNGEIVGSQNAVAAPAPVASRTPVDAAGRPLKRACSNCGRLFPLNQLYAVNPPPQIDAAGNALIGVAATHPVNAVVSCDPCHDDLALTDEKAHALINPNNAKLDVAFDAKGRAIDAEAAGVTASDLLGEDIVTNEAGQRCVVRGVDRPVVQAKLKAYREQQQLAAEDRQKEATVEEAIKAHKAKQVERIVGKPAGKPRRSRR